MDTVYELGRERPVAQIGRRFTRVCESRLRLFLICHGWLHTPRTIQEVHAMSGRLRDDIGRLIDGVCPDGVGHAILEVRDGSIGMRKYYEDGSPDDVYVIVPDRDRTH